MGSCAPGFRGGTAIGPPSGCAPLLHSVGRNRKTDTVVGGRETAVRDVWSICRSTWRGRSRRPQYLYRLLSGCPVISALVRLPALMTLPWLVLVNSIAYAELPECRDESVRAFVEQIEDVRDLDSLAFLTAKPRDSAACLIRQLRVVDASILKPEDAHARPSDFRVVWTVRALRYVTGGLDFCASTAHEDQLDDQHRQFLRVRCPSPDVSFFGVWMSRDVTFLAPRDAQESIIHKWVQWYEKNGDTYAYRPATSGDWYF